MQACLYEPLFYEWTIWRKPNTEEKRSFCEVAWTLIYGNIRRKLCNRRTRNWDKEEKVLCSSKNMFEKYTFL